MNAENIVQRAIHENAEGRKVSLRALRSFRRCAQMRDLGNALRWYGTLHQLRGFEFDRSVGAYGEGCVKSTTLRRMHRALLRLVVVVAAGAIK